MFSPFKNNRLKLSIISEFSNLVYGKNENLETPEINEKVCEGKTIRC